MKPPFVAQAVLAATCPPTDYDSVAGDLHEEYARRTASLGAAAANCWYWSQTLRSIPSLLLYSRAETTVGGAAATTSIVIAVLLGMFAFKDGTDRVLDASYGGHPHIAHWLYFTIDWAIAAVAGMVLALAVRRHGVRLTLIASLALLAAFAIPIAIGVSPRLSLPAWVLLAGAVPAMCLGAGAYQVLRRSGVWMLCALVLLCGARAHAAPQPLLGLHLAPCMLGKIKAAGECGTFGVYENRRARTGRIIPLHVVIMKALHPAHPAIAEIAGGPGEAATDYPAFILDGDFGKARLSLHGRYDFIFVDNRGMGTSNPLPCDLTPPSNPTIYFRSVFPPAIIAKCRASNAATHDLSSYNTQTAVDDLDDVRAALGYPQIILDGGSYGTFFSMVYLRRHGAHVESAILDGVTAPHFQPLPGSPDGAQNALSDLEAKCKQDRRCNTHFPDFAAHFDALVHRFDAGSIAMRVAKPATKRGQTVALSKEVFVDQVRHVLYAPGAAAYLPYIVERAYRRDYTPLANMIQTVAVGMEQGMPMGANLSYTCSDWMPFLDPAQIAYAREHTFAGDLRLRAQQQACAIWNVRPMPAAFNNPVRSNVPVLMILGSGDPATPATYGLQALQYLPNGRAILVKGAGHGADDACTDALLLAFLKHDSAKNLDVDRCSASFALPPFATSMKGWP